MSTPHPLRKWRENAKPKPLSQAELGELLGIGASQISQIETRQRSCSLDIALKIRGITGEAVPLEYLLRSKSEADQ